MSSKFASRRFWIAVWAIALVTALTGMAVFRSFDAAWLGSVLTFLLGIIGAYVGLETWNKPRLERKDPKCGGN